MAICNTEKVLSVHHWTDSLFSFTTTRDKSLRFKNGHFLMIGLQVNEKPLLRAYSVVSPNYQDYLEFLSEAVQDWRKENEIPTDGINDDRIAVANG